MATTNADWQQPVDALNDRAVRPMSACGAPLLRARTARRGGPVHGVGAIPAIA